LDLIDGIGLDALVKNRRHRLLDSAGARESGRSAPPRIIAKASAPSAPTRCVSAFAALATYGRTINFDLKTRRGLQELLQQAVECGAVCGR